MRRDTHQRVVGAVLRYLGGRKGFDAWWDSIDQDIRGEITEGLEAIVAPMLLSPAPAHFGHQLQLF